MLQHTKCRSIGTSKGVIIPNDLLKFAKINLNDELDIDYSELDNAIVIKKTNRRVRYGWGNAFKQLSVQGGDELLISDGLDSDFDDESI